MYVYLTGYRYIFANTEHRAYVTNNVSYVYSLLLYVQSHNVNTIIGKHKQS